MTTWITAQNAVSCKEVHGTAIESYNAISGNPEYRVRLAVTWANRTLAISQLLGKPEKWPHSTVFNAYAISASVTNDRSNYITDSDTEIINYQGSAFIDVVYIPRTGVYVRDFNGQNVYWDDIVEPRIEVRPLSPELFIWGGTSPTVLPALSDQLPPSVDQLPGLPVSGQTLYHNIEGWYLTRYIQGSYIDNFIGTTHNASYYSPGLDYTFEPESLLLRSYTIQKHFSFNSMVAADPLAHPYNDGGGKANFLLKMVYEYKPKGWNRIYRYVPEDNIADWYYLRYAQGNKGLATIFPTRSHSNFLDYASLI